MTLLAKRNMLSRTFLGVVLPLAGLFLFAPLVHASTTITTCTQLQNIGATTTEPASGSYVLGNTIDCSASATWNPIGGGAYFGFSPLANFTGTLNGNGNTITGLYENYATSTNIGLFSAIGSGGVVENVTIASSTIIGVSDVGVLAGASNSGTVQNVTVQGGTVTGTSTAEFIGGLIGNNTGTVSTSSAAVAVSGGSYVGGLIGENGGAINGSWATGNVSSTINGSEFIGGLIGCGASGATISGSYSTGTVVASGNNDEYVAGLIGYEDAAISNSYSTSPVTANGSGSDYIAGLVGENEAGSLASTSASGLVSATGHASEYVAGLVGLSYGTINNSYSIGNVVATSTSEYVAGFDAYMDGGSIMQSYETGNVTGAYYSMGGFTSESYGTITQSFETGNLYLYGYTGYYDYYIGGFAGYADAALTNDYATGNIVIDSTVVPSYLYYTAGFVGYNDAPITNSYSSGSIIGNGAYTYMGGFVGVNDDPIVNSYFAGGGTALLLSSTTSNTGYFIGNTTVNTLANDAQFYNGTPAIGNDTTTSGSDALLATHSYGTDEHTLSNFYTTTEAVYAQATTTAWNFSSIWETHPSSFPTFQWFSPPTPTYTITASAGTGGVINNSGVFTVMGGANQSYMIIVNSGYAIANVIVDGVSVGAVSTYTFSNVSTNHTIVVTFTAIVSSSGSESGGGSIPNQVSNLLQNGNNKVATALINEFPNLFTATVSTAAGSTTTSSGISSVVSGAAKIKGTLSYKSRNNSVKILQALLAADPSLNYTGGVTGYYGRATEAAVEAFQIQKGVVKKGRAGYGSVGPKTRLALIVTYGE